MQAEARVEAIRAQLQAALRTQSVEVIDDSRLHVGHAGARDGKGHFRVRVVSEDFSGLRPLQRHQLVYKALGDRMGGEIHALQLETLTPDELPAGSH
jgi:BolA protein